MGDDSAARDAQLHEVMDDCRCRRLAGEVVCDDTLIAAHPQLMPELGDELRKLRLIAAAREQAAQPIAPEVATRSHRGSDRGSGSSRLEIRCPNCHQPTEVAADTTLTDLTCSACGSHFSLVNQSNATRMAPSLAKLGRFELIERLGVGGFGSVWKARDKELDRTVAIKIPRAGGMTGEEQEKFFREARAAAQLCHPSIVSVHEVGRDGDSVYIVSDYVRGVTLGDWLTGQQLTSREAAELCAKIADALHHAHEQGVVHRDLKPANIMIDCDGQPHLMDFGLARREVGEVTLTMDGQVLGTPAYMSPEQAQGEAHTADCRSDVYSLGVILFQLLTGELPFRGNVRMIMHQVIHEEPPSPRKLNANIKRDLETISLKCLEKEPAKRYQTAKEFADECRRYLNGNPIHARPISRMARGWRWIKRRPTAAALLGLLVVVALVAPLVALQQSALVMTKKQALTQLAKKNDEQNSQLVRSLIERGSWHCESGSPLQAIALFAGAYSLARTDDPLRASARNLSAAWSATARLRVALVSDSPVCAGAFSPDGRSVLTGSDDKTARLWDAATGKSMGESLRHDGTVKAVAFSPDGRTVLTGSDDKTARLWDAATGKPIGEPLRHDGPVKAVAFNPNGRTVLTGSHDQTARLWDAATGKPIGEPMRHDGAVSAVAFNPNGRTVLTGSHDQTARLWDAATGKPIGEPMRKSGYHVNAVAFSPDGLTLLSGSDDNTAQLWDVATGKPVREPMRHKGSVSSVAYSRDGHMVLTGSYDGTVRLWDVATGKPVDDSMRSDYGINAVAFSPDGQTVLCVSFEGAVRLWKVGARKPMGKPLRHERQVNAVAFSPDGRMVLTSSNDGTARLWNFETQVPLHAPMRHEGMVKAAAFSPDGLKIVTGSGDQTARLWDVATGRPIGEPMRHGNGVNAVAFSPDGRMVLTGSGDRTTRLWDITTGKPLGPAMNYDSAVTAVAFSPDGRIVLTGNDDFTARLCDVVTGKSVGEPMRHDSYVNAVAFSPDGLTALTGSADATARLWDATTGKPLGEPMRHDSYVNAVAFSPDGLTAVTGSADGTARLWDAATRKPFGEPMHHTGGVHAVAFQTDGHTLITGCVDGSARFWRVPLPLPDNPKLVRNWADVKTGMVLDEQGLLRRLSQTEWLKARNDLEKLRSDQELP